MIPRGASLCPVGHVCEAQREFVPRLRLGELLRERLAPFTAPDIVQAVGRIDGTLYVSFRSCDILLMPQPWTPQMTSGGGMAIEDAGVLDRGTARPW